VWLLIYSFIDWRIWRNMSVIISSQNFPHFTSSTFLVTQSTHENSTTHLSPKKQHEELRTRGHNKSLSSGPKLRNRITKKMILALAEIFDVSWLSCIFFRRYRASVLFLKILDYYISLELCLLEEKSFIWSIRKEWNTCSHLAIDVWDNMLRKNTKSLQK
jgi:hypothetical protein